MKGATAPTCSTKLSATASPAPPIIDDNNKMPIDYTSLFKMPTQLKITGRSSTITSAFVNSIIPAIPPSAEEIKEALSLLGMTSGPTLCSYCGDVNTEWDHLRPLVIDKMPTGVPWSLQP